MKSNTQETKITIRYVIPFSSSSRTVLQIIVKKVNGNVDAE